jgi:hypothetical protein
MDYAAALSPAKDCDGASERAVEFCAFVAQFRLDDLPLLARAPMLEAMARAIERRH